MAYGLKYTSSFYSEAWSGTTSTQYILKIYKEGFSGSSEEVCMGGSPCTEKAINSDDLPWGVKGCRYEFQVVSDTLSVNDFYTEDGKDFLFELYEAGTPDILIRKGYLISEDVSEEYSDGVKTITITGTDGLELLKTINYELIDDKAYQGIASVFSILFNCLDKIGLGIKFNTAFNYYPNGITAGDGIDSLAFHSLHQELFKGLTCYEVLERLTNTHQCVLEQEDGEWWYIHKTNPSGATVTYRKWTPFGALIDDYTLPEPIDVVFEGEYAPVERPQVLKNRPYKRVISEVDLKGYENKLRNADFQDGLNNWYANGIAIDNEFGGLGTNRDPYYIQLNGYTSEDTDLIGNPTGASGWIGQSIVQLFNETTPESSKAIAFEKGLKISGKVKGNDVKKARLQVLLRFVNVIPTNSGTLTINSSFYLTESGEWYSTETPFGQFPRDEEFIEVNLTYETNKSKEEYSSFEVSSVALSKAVVNKNFLTKIFENRLYKMQLTDAVSCSIGVSFHNGYGRTTEPNGASYDEWIRWADLNVEVIDLSRAIGLKKNRYISQKSGVAPTELKVERYFADYYNTEQFITILGSDSATPTSLWTTTNNNNTGDLLTALTRELFSLYYKPVSLYDGNILGRVKKYHTINLVDYSEPLFNINWGYDFGRNIVDGSRYIMTFPVYVGNDNKKYGVYADDKEILYDGEYPTGGTDFDIVPTIYGESIARNLPRITENTVFDNYLTFSKISNESGINWYDSLTGDKTDYFVTSDEGFKFKSASSDFEVNLDFSELTADTILKVPVLAGISTIATDTTAWMLNGNTLLLEGKLGSINNETVRLVANDQYKISLIASGGIMVHHATTFEDDIDAEGNITIQKGNPRLRLRDSGGSVHTSGFDVHVNGDSFLIDDNTHSRNILKNYLSSTTHITEFDADEYYFKDGATTYASLIGGNLNLPSLTASQLVATDASKNLVSLSTSTYPSLTELSYVKGVTSAIQTQLNSKFNTPSGLTTNYVTKWNGTALANSQIFDNGTNVGVGTASPEHKLQVAGGIYGTGSTAPQSATVSGYGIGATGGLPYQYSKYTAGATDSKVWDNYSDGANLVFRAVNDANTVAPTWMQVNRTGTTINHIAFPNGNVGIGTTSPSEKLHVQGAIISTGGITGHGANRATFSQEGFNGAFIQSYGNNTSTMGQFYFRQASSDFSVTNIPLYISPSGNVGIGTTSPDRKLVVNGDIGFVYSDGSSYSGIRQDLSGGHFGLKFFSAITGSLYNRSYEFLGHSGGALVTILNGGNVGIGTTNPYEKLDVIGTSRTTNLKITNGATVGYVWQCNNADGSGVWTSPLSSERYIGEWAANSGSAPSGSPTTGDYWVVNTAGTYSGTTYALGDEIYWNGTTWLKRSNYLALPIATTSTLGGVKVGSGLSIDGSGIVSVGTLNQNTTGNAGTATTLQTTRNIAISGDLTWSVNFNGSADVTAVGTLATVNANVGTFNNVTVNAKGLVTAASNVSYLTTNQTITLSGDVTGSGTTAITATLANSGVTAGTYTKITVDAKGRATSGTTLSASDIPSLDWSKITTGKPTTLSGYGIIDAQPLNANLTSISGLDDSTGFVYQSGADTFTKRTITSYSPLNFDVDTGDFTISMAGTASNGYLHQDDWNFFNTKQGRISNYLGYNEETDGLVLMTNNLSFEWVSFNTYLSTSTALNNIYQAKDATLTALAGLDTNGGIVTQIGTDAFAKRTISGTTNRISITNGNGVSGNPTIDISSSYAGQASITTLGTITTGVWNGGVIPILYGGTGSSTQNFVDLSTIQSINGQKTFNELTTLVAGALVGNARLTLGSGTALSGGSTLQLGLIEATDTVADGLFFRTQTGGAVLTGIGSQRKMFLNSTGLRIGNSLGRDDIPSEILHIDGNIRVSGAIKPDNVAPTAGHFLKGVDANNMSWSAITVSDISDIATNYQPLLPSGTSGQFLVKDSTNTNNFMNLELKPMYLSHRHIPVGSYFDNYSEVRNLTFEANRVLRVSNISNQTNSVNLGITGNDTDGILEYMGIGDFWLKSQRDIYIDNFKGGGDRFLKVTTTGKVYASTSGGSSGGAATLTTNYVGFGDSGNTLTGSANFQWSDGRFLRIQDKTNTARFMGFGYNTGATEAVFTSEATSGSPLGLAIYSPSIKFSALASGTTQMVVANSVGVLSLQSIPSGGGGVGTIDQVLGAGNTAYKKTFNFENESESYINFKRHTGEVVGGIAYQSAVDKYLSIVSDNGHDILLDSDRNLLMLGTDINIGYSNTTGLINIQGMPFNFNENAQNSGSGQNGSQWGSGFNQAAPVAGDRMLFFFDGTRWVPSHVRTYVGAGGKTYLTID